MSSKTNLSATSFYASIIRYSLMIYAVNLVPSYPPLGELLAAIYIEIIGASIGNVFIIYWFEGSFNMWLTVEF